MARSQPTWIGQPLSIYVFRNQPFEFAVSPLTAFASYAGWDVNVVMSGYDDTLSEPSGGGADVVLVWLDYSHYSLPPEELSDWLVGRIQSLQSHTSVPVLVFDSAPSVAGSSPESVNRALRVALAPLPDVHLVAQSELARQLGSSYFDERNRVVAGSPISDLAYVLTGRHVAFDWLPVLAGEPIRAVIVDLDGTLYEGVLGEEGPLGVRILPGHQDIVRELLEARARGVYLGTVSKNDPSDVVALFEQRQDLLLRPEHLSAQSVSWGDKAVGLDNVLDQLRLGPESVLYVDDNAGELASLANQAPGLRLLWADPVHPDATAQALRIFPGLHRPTRSDADTIRLADLQAAHARTLGLARAFDVDDYVRSLRAEVSLSLNPTSYADRLAELSHKANQFNTSFRRFSATDFRTFMADPGSRVVAAALNDRLSDSGVVFSAVFRREVNTLVVVELALSCRALGRGVETPLILAAIYRVSQDLDTSEVAFDVREGPRNGPALDWLSSILGRRPESPRAEFDWEPRWAARVVADAPILLRWQPDD